MSELSEMLSRDIAALKRTRDELRLEVHLAKKEVQERFEQLETKWREIEARTAAARRASGESVRKLADKTRMLVDEVRGDYRQLKRSLGQRGGETMKVDELMTKDVHPCGPHHSLDQAARIMWEHDCGAVPVVDDSRHVVAMITDRDICMAAYTQGKPLREIRVGSAMSRQLYSCKPYETVDAAEEIMWMRQVRRLPVTDDSGHLVGVVSLNDIARNVPRRDGALASSLSAHGVALTLAAISEPPGPPEHLAAE